MAKQPSKENWESWWKESHDFLRIQGIEPRAPIVNFIEKLLFSERQAVLKEIIEEIKKRILINETEPCLSKKRDNPDLTQLGQGYNEALFEIKSLIEKKLE